MTVINVCGGGITFRRVMFCPICEKRRRFVCLWSAWYDTSVTCCGCGDSWCGGELRERPFRRGWRQEAIALARFQWRNALDNQAAREAMRAELDAIIADCRREAS